MGGASMRRWHSAVLADPLNATLYSVDPGGRQTHWHPPAEWREEAQRWRQLHGANIQLPFVPPRAKAGSVVWRTRLVGVVASFDGKTPKMSAAPERITLVVYQRVDPSRPHYSPNYGFEGGVFIQFVLTYYDCLPNQTLFLQEGMRSHNKYWLEWAHCLLPEAPWAPLTDVRLQIRGTNGQTLDVTHAYDALTEQCWRNLLAVFNRSHLMQPGRKQYVAYFGGSLAAVSRSQFRRHPRSAFEAAHRMLAGGDGRCVLDELQWGQLAARRTRASLPYDAPLSGGKHTSAAAFEALHAVLFGELGLQDAYLFDFCTTFRHKRACPRSPCPDVQIDVIHLANYGDYESSLFTTELRTRAFAEHKANHDRRQAEKRAAKAKKAKARAAESAGPGAPASRSALP